MRVGDSLIERITTAIREVEFVVALVLEASVESNWCKKELSLAITGGLGREGARVLPLRVADVDMPPALADTFRLALVPSPVSDAAGQIKKDAEACLADERRAPHVGGHTLSRATPRSSACRAAMRSGRLTENVDPSPGREVRTRPPPIASARRRAMNRPRPKPPAV